MSKIFYILISDPRDVPKRKLFLIGFRNEKEKNKRFRKFTVFTRYQGLG